MKSCQRFDSFIHLDLATIIKRHANVADIGYPTLLVMNCHACLHFFYAVAQYGQGPSFLVGVGRLS